MRRIIPRMWGFGSISGTSSDLDEPKGAGRSSFYPLSGGEWDDNVELFQELSVQFFNEKHRFMLTVHNRWGCRGALSHV